MRKKKGKRKSSPKPTKAHYKAVKQASDEIKSERVSPKKAVWIFEGAKEAVLAGAMLSKNRR